MIEDMLKEQNPEEQSKKFTVINDSDFEIYLFQGTEFKEAISKKSKIEIDIINIIWHLRTENHIDKGRMLN